MFRIKMQHHSCDFAPVRTFRICVEQAQIRDEVLLVVRGQHGIGGRNIGDIGIKRWRLRGRSRNRLLIDLTLLWTPWHMMTSTGEVRFAPDCVAKVFLRHATQILRAIGATIE
jgi:hypothetical protein